MRPVIIGILVGASVLVLPMAFDETGAFRLTAEPTPLEVMKDTPGELVARAPRQIELDKADRTEVLVDGYHIRASDSFDIDAVVLSRRNYRAGRTSDLSPMDLALGWQQMSDPAVLKQIEISQSGRFYFYSWGPDFDRNPAVIGYHSSNMHMIPADDTVKASLGQIRSGDIVRIRGFLVNVRADDGWHWLTSRTRTDTGNGACEIVYVTRVDVMDLSSGG